MNQGVLPEDLPGVLGVVAEKVSLTAAFKLAAEFGGTLVYIPERVSDESPLARALGVADARAVAAALGRGNIEIPLGPFATHARRRAEIRRLLAGGTSGQEVARRLWVSARTVRKVRNADGDERQLDLLRNTFRGP